MLEKKIQGQFQSYGSDIWTHIGKQKASQQGQEQYQWIYLHNFKCNLFIQKQILKIHIVIYILKIHSLATSLGTTGLDSFLPSELIFQGINSTRFWKQSLGSLVNIDMTALWSCCRCVGCTSMMRILVPPHPKGALLD